MIIKTKKNRELILINAQNTQNENKAETIEIYFPEEFESYNKKIVFITPNETVWDVIQNNRYKITNAITQYGQVDFYVWLTKDDEDWRSVTKTLKFYDNVDASEEITPEEISGVNTVINMLEAEITKVENLNITASKVGTITTLTITDKEGNVSTVQILDGQNGRDGQDGRDGNDYVITEADYQAIANIVLEDVNIPTKTSDLQNDSGFVTKNVNDLVNYELKTNTGASIELSVNSSTYVMTLNLKNSAGTVLSTGTIDLPLESVVVGGSYDSTNQKIVLTLQNGNTIDIPVGALVSGLQTEITSQNKLASDLVDDTNQTNKFVSTSEKTTWNGKYDKPVGGIPATDLAENYEVISNKVASISSSSTNTEYPSAKAVYDYIDITITQAIGGAY